MRRRFWFAAVLTLPLVFIAMGDMLPGRPVSSLMSARTRVWLELALGDVQQMSYPDESFDMVVATFLFCAVPDPVLGLRKARRVLKPGGQLLLLEHVLSQWPPLRRIMTWFVSSPLAPVPGASEGARWQPSADIEIDGLNVMLGWSQSRDCDHVKHGEAL